MNDVKVVMTIEIHGRWYRFVQCDGPTWECAKCVFYRDCAQVEGECPISRNLSYCIAGHFERFRPAQELVRIGVRLLRRLALKHSPYSPFVCHGPKYPTDSDNEITFFICGDHRDEMPQEILALIDRLNLLGLII